MDPDRPPRKVQFAPKAPSQRKNKAVAVSKTKKDDSNASEAQEQSLLRQRVAEFGNRRQSSKDKGKAPIQATFIHGGKRSGDDDSVDQSLSPEEDGSEPKEYREPWDYANTNYPITLPWRRPPAGNPDVLDEAEFGEDAEKLEYDENAVNHASELGLNPDQISEKTRLLFFQFPQSLPAIKRTTTAAAKGKEVKQSGPGAMNTDAKGSSTGGASQRTCSLEELPAGYMGKLLVYKSGAIKLRLGNTLFDVWEGTQRSFAEEVVAINTEEKECCSIGTIDKHAVVVLDSEHILECE